MCYLPDSDGNLTVSSLNLKSITPITRSEINNLKKFSSGRTSEKKSYDSQLKKMYKGLSEPRKERLEKGVSFLQSLVPAEIIHHQELLNCSKKIQSLEKISSFFLNALVLDDPNKDSLVNSYKLVLLKSSNELYAHLEKNLEEILKKNENTPGKSITTSEKKQIQQLLSKWKIELEAQKQETDPGLVNLGVSIISSLLSALSVPINSPLFKLIPSQLVIEITSSVLSGLGVILKSCRIAILAIEIFVRNKQVKKIDNWSEDYKLWKEKNQTVSPMNSTKSDLYEKPLAVHNKKLFKAEQNFKEVQRGAWNDSVKRILKETDQDLPSQVAIDQELAKWKDLSKLSLQEKKVFLDLLSNQKGQEEFFETWFATLPIPTKQKLLLEYTNRQEVLESTLKGAVGQMISKKHEVEGVLSHFKLRSAKIYLAEGVATIALVATLTAIAILVFPIPGIAILFSLLTAASLLVSFGLVGKSFYLGFKYMPEVSKSSFKLLSARRVYTEIRRDIENYTHQKKMNKMLGAAIFLDKMKVKFQGGSKEKKDSALYNEASRYLAGKRVEIRKSANKLKVWDERLEKLEAEHYSNAWKDFSKLAGLKLETPGLDGLGRLVEVLKEVDFHLLSKETKYLLQVHMGVDVKSLQKEKKENPEEFQAGIEKTFKKLASLTDFEFSQFITRQKSLIQKNLIKI